MTTPKRQKPESNMPKRTPAESGFSIRSRDWRDGR
jgi:hypothetical protein